MEWISVKDRLPAVLPETYFRYKDSKDNEEGQSQVYRNTRVIVYNGDTWLEAWYHDEWENCAGPHSKTMPRVFANRHGVIHNVTHWAVPNLP